MLTLAQLKLTKVKRTPALANPCTQHFVIYISCVTNHGSIFCFSPSPNLPSVRLFKTGSAFRMEASIDFLCMQQGDYEFHCCDAPVLQNISHTYTCQKSEKNEVSRVKCGDVITPLLFLSLITLVIQTSL